MNDTCPHCDESRPSDRHYQDAGPFTSGEALGHGYCPMLAELRNRRSLIAAVGSVTHAGGVEPGVVRPAPLLPLGEEQASIGALEVT